MSLGFESSVFRLSLFLLFSLSPERNCVMVQERDKVVRSNYKVLFRFGDNDFGATFRRVFSLLQEKYEECAYYDATYPSRGSRYTDLFLNKEYVCQFINTLALPIYKTLQCDNQSGFQVNEARFSSLEEQDRHYADYLKATPDRIYIGPEIDELIARDAGCANGDWWVYDASIHDPNCRVYPF